MIKRLPLFLVLLLIGCRVGPEYEPPCTEIPEGWKGVTRSDEVEVDEWLEVFEDERLSELEQQAVENSPTLYIALERVVEARALAGVVGANLYPQLGLNPSYDNRAYLMKATFP